jgi:hypothetical protein
MLDHPGYAGYRGDAMKGKETADKGRRDDTPEEERRDQRKGTWADEAAKARTSDDPRARTPSDAVGQPSTRSLDE